jgi:PIH1 CS-like domain
MHACARVQCYDVFTFSNITEDGHSSNKPIAELGVLNWAAMHMAAASFGGPRSHIFIELACAFVFVRTFRFQQLTLCSSHYCSKLSLFLPHKVDAQKAKAKFDVNRRVLDVTMPIIRDL